MQIPVAHHAPIEPDSFKNTKQNKVPEPEKNISKSIPIINQPMFFSIYVICLHSDITILE